jgi:hypothetical protein
VNKKPNISTAGIWAPVNPSYLTASTYGTIIPFSSLIKLDGSGEYGIVLNGWGWQGEAGGGRSHVKVKMAILSKDSSGILSINTQNYVSDPSNNGSGSVLVTDFNGDGLSDIFLAAHNESPFVAMPSTVYLSNLTGGFTKLTLNDSVMAHDAQIVYINSQPVVVTTTFPPGDINPIYKYSNGNFIKTLPDVGSAALGMSSIIAPFGLNGALELVRTDVRLGYDPSTNYFKSSDIYVYRFDGNKIVSDIPVQVIQPYLSTLPQYKDYISFFGKNLTHAYRIWKDDLNQDGKPDLLSAQAMFPSNSDPYPSCLQILINKGDGTFKDMTGTLNPEIGFNHDAPDYNPTFLDLDQSGINTYLFATSGKSLSRHFNYVLLNDGTGRLYTAVHDQFNDLTTQVFAFVKQSYGDSFSIDTSLIPRFIAVPQIDGSLNFVAMVNGFTKINNSTFQNNYAFINIPLSYNITTDFTQNITITDRNQSMLMRTWAGNDKFYDTNANSAAANVDGGLGVDTSIYSGAYSQYKVSALANNTLEVKLTATNSVAPKVVDTLTNVERLQFTDTTIALDISKDQTAGSGYMLYKAAFNRTPDVGGLGFWINKMDGGMSYSDVAKNFVGSAEFKTAFGGSNPSVNTLVTKLYNNVLARAPDAGGLAFWQEKLTTGWSTADVLGYFSTSAENVTNVTPLIANGIQYQQFVG